MAWIERREGKKGVSYRISVSCGTDSNGHQIIRRTTWKPEPKMTERQIQKAVERAASTFEQEITQGYQLDNRETFSSYARYVIDLKKRGGLKQRTYERYYELMERIDAGIGHIKLVDLRPQHLNAFYKNLCEPGIRSDLDKAVAKTDISAELKMRKMTKSALSQLSHSAPATITAVCNGHKIRVDKATEIAAALGCKLTDLFRVEKNTNPLSNKTVLEYHRLICSVLAQADKEMLIPYNAAAKASPPKATRSDVNYFQPEEVEAILAALEDEPIKWRTITHLLIVTGCRRGEIMGLKWEKVDLKRKRLKIDTALLYSQKSGIYETTTKTSDHRTLAIPDETVELLKQYRRWQFEQRILNGDRWQESGYVFTKENGAPCQPDTITTWLRKFSDRRGLPHINPHAFRHTVASILIANGTDVVTVSKQLGHASVTTTESFYSHIIEEAKEQATECIAAVLLRKPKLPEASGSK